MDSRLATIRTIRRSFMRSRRTAAFAATTSRPGRRAVFVHRSHRGGRGFGGGDDATPAPPPQGLASGCGKGVRRVRQGVLRVRRGCAGCGRGCGCRGAAGAQGAQPGRGGGGRGAGDRANWDTPYMISPHSPSRLYWATQYVYRSDDRGDTWTRISPDLSRNLDPYHDTDHGEGLAARLGRAQHLHDRTQ